MSRIGWAKGEVPRFAFCESVNASSISPWHIREVNSSTGLKFGGGIDTPPLCQRFTRGWDLNVRIEEGHLKHACADCVKKYREVQAKAQG